MRAKMDEYSLVIKKLAEENDAIYIDTQEVFNEFLKYRHSSYLAWDRIHPNLPGHMLICRAFLNAIEFEINPSI